MLGQLVKLLTFQELVILFSLITFIVKILNRLKQNRGYVRTVIQAKITLKRMKIYLIIYQRINGPRASIIISFVHSLSKLGSPLDKINEMNRILRDNHPFTRISHLSQLE